MLQNSFLSLSLVEGGEPAPDYGFFFNLSPKIH